MILQSSRTRSPSRLRQPVFPDWQAPLCSARAYRQNAGLQINDASGNGNTLILPASGVTWDAKGVVYNRTDACYNLDWPVPAANAPFTVFGVWSVTGKTLPNYYGLFGMGEWWSGAFWFGLWGDGSHELMVQSETASYTSSYIPANGEWFSAAASYDGTAYWVYVNGVLQNAGGTSAALSFTATRLMLGALYQGSVVNIWNGGIAVFDFAGAAHDATRIKSAHNWYRARLRNHGIILPEAS